jgi:hypothetical protein
LSSAAAAGRASRKGLSASSSLHGSSWFTFFIFAKIFAKIILIFFVNFSEQQNIRKTKINFRENALTKFLFQP